jgi:hypothetical protein
MGVELLEYTFKMLASFREPFGQFSTLRPLISETFRTTEAPLRDASIINVNKF